MSASGHKSKSPQPAGTGEEDSMRKAMASSTVLSGAAQGHTAGPSRKSTDLSLRTSKSTTSAETVIASNQVTWQPLLMPIMFVTQSTIARLLVQEATPTAQRTPRSMPRVTVGASNAPAKMLVNVGGPSIPDSSPISQDTNRVYLRNPGDADGKAEAYWSPEPGD